MILADTAAQAQAQLLEIIRRVGKDDGIDVRGAEEMKVRPLADDYGEVVVAVSFALPHRAIREFHDRPRQPARVDRHQRHSGGRRNPKEKTVLVRLGLSGVVPRKLVPEKKGPASL
jgi:hypothetical protein